MTPPPRQADHSTATPQRTFLGFDHGLKRIGIAFGQTLTRSARPLTTLPARAGEPDWDALARLLHEWRPDALVVGVPVHMDGAEHERTRAARRFALRLSARYGLPVHVADERLTSDEAQRLLQAERRPRAAARMEAAVDAVAAKLILETWLNQQEPSDDADPTA